MNISDLRAKLYRMFLNIYKLFETDRQKNNNYIFAKLFLINNECALQYSDIGILNNSTLKLVDIKNIDLEYIYNLTNKISDINKDNRNDRNNKIHKANRDNRDNKDDEDNRKSSSHVLENTECEKARK
ncbi:uncharacterized protein CIMG_13349 [Coccidioides immitis RS]|uniref:Uncharacterized protein n=1 Tax=Coccidioides immitis (strain RS) TaxID=246410 RepID=J3KD62_COCIM|nr:uncharacterized protein CIMG_13349 [Coccidioides immitis RS]EAS33253.3 hypothetical protein CIMG_13349 [Coccidioides immitis RS]